MFDPFPLLLAALLGLASGFVGGWGGRRLALWGLLGRLGALEEALQGFDDRLRKREGREGAQKRELQKEALDAVQVEIAKHIAGWPALRPPAVQPASVPGQQDRREILRQAHANGGALPQKG